MKDYGLKDPPEDQEELKSIQRDVAEKARFTDGSNTAEIIAGVDQAFVDDGEIAVSAAVATRNDQQVASAVARRPAKIPYIPGFLAFREGQAVVASLMELPVDPDVVLVDGSGRIHPRQAGLATHVGVTLDLPTVGVAKSLLCGELREPVDKLEEGDRVAIHAGEEVDAQDDEIIGYAVQTKQYSESSSTYINPLYVSPGHRVDAESAACLVLNSCEGYKLPQSLRRADILAGEKKTSL